MVRWWAWGASPRMATRTPSRVFTGATCWSSSTRRRVCLRSCGRVWRPLPPRPTAASWPLVTRTTGRPPSGMCTKRSAMTPCGTGSGFRPTPRPTSLVSTYHHLFLTCCSSEAGSKTDEQPGERTTPDSSPRCWLSSPTTANLGCSGLRYLPELSSMLTRTFEEREP